MFWRVCKIQVDESRLVWACKKSETLKSSCQASYQAAFSLWPPFYYHDPKLISIGKILLGVRRRSIHTLLHSNRILLFLEQHNIVLMPLSFFEYIELFSNLLLRRHTIEVFCPFIQESFSNARQDEMKYMLTNLTCCWSKTISKYIYWKIRRVDHFMLFHKVYHNRVCNWFGFCLVELTSTTPFEKVQHWGKNDNCVS